MKIDLLKAFLVFVCVGFFSDWANAQLAANADAVLQTEYSSGGPDQIFIFCVAPGEKEASLTAGFSSGTAADFEWLKYNPATGLFDVFLSDNSGGVSSTVSGLDDGGYRVNVTSGGITETYTAWVFNNWYTATAQIGESTCDYFQLQASFEGVTPVYYDLGTGAPIEIFKDVKVKWTVDGDQVAAVLNPQIFNPPPRNTDYVLTVYDRFDCDVQASVSYQSIVTEASFTATPMSGETPLPVTFVSTSENADQYEWFFFRDLDEMKLEAQQAGSVADSIMDRAIDANPVYTYQKSGTYGVKLVTTKNSEFGACTDTVYLDDYIIADTSFVEAPNVFTPNGDGDNDVFRVKYRSLKQISIKIFNRWGKQIFAWENNNVQGFEESVTESVWDGKIGGRLASPGVYYYVVEARGRDDKKRNAHGFVHLFREK